MLSMFNLIKKFKVISLVIEILGIISAISVFLCCYFLSDQISDFTNLYLILLGSLLVGFSVVQCIFTFVFCYKLNKKRHITDLKASDIVGNDIGAAYDFGQIGLIVVDNDGNVLWLNDFMEDRGINIVDVNIAEFDKQLADIFIKKSEDDSLNACNIVHDNKNYQVKYIRGANLFVLRDTTAYESLLKNKNDHEPVIGYFKLDNYQDMPTSSDIEKVQQESELRKLVTDYFEKYNCLVKFIDVDYYLILLVQEDFQKLLADKFSIIKTIATKYSKEGLTASLSFGYGFPDYNRNNTLASDSLNLALIRGGNQCAVAPFGENVMFYGSGNNETKNSNNRVRINANADLFKTCVKKYDNIIIVPHIYADMDAIGAALGVYAMCKSFKVKSNILYESKNVESSTDKASRAILSNEFFSSIFVNLQTAKTLKSPNTLIVMVDHNSTKQSIVQGLIDERYDHIAIIDHHPLQANSVKETVFSDVDTGSSSTCELLSLYIDSYKIKIDLSKEEATLMLSGIYLDTANFKQKTRILTHEACIILSRQGADEKMARDFLKEDYEKFALKSKIVSNVEMLNRDVLLACADEDVIVDAAMLASVCNELKEIESTKICFAIGKVSESETYVSSRGNGQVSCEVIMRHLGGGGHVSAAATKLKDVSVSQVKEQLKHVLDEYLDDAIISESDDDK